jgi:hypothetical protein
MSFRRLFLFTLVLAATMCLLTSTTIFAQSFTTGEITGTVTDPSGAVLPNVTVALKSVEKGFTQSGTSNAQGVYRFALLSPGSYTVTATASGFKTTTETTTVAVGATAITNIKLEVGSTTTTVEVTGEIPLLQTDSSEIATTMNTLAVQSLPNPGNDLSFIAQTAPGSTMNTQSGYGNFSSFGISATSNLFTINGMYDNDPFLNLNNSGATNLLLGNNEIQEVDVVSNGYSGEYGGFAGATVNYVTKSGSNDWHGNAAYWWNGRVMNANDWFSNNTIPVTPKTFDNANQYATSFGGPIKKDKAFFFANYEGLRVVIPVTQTVSVPTTQFENATLANLNHIGMSASVPFYNQMFNLWNNAPGHANAVPESIAAGCAGFSDPVSGVGITQPCAENWRSSVTNLTHEYLLAGRFDFNLTSKDKLFIRMQEDKGLQATYADPIAKVFYGQSTQPEYQGQASWNHSFGTRAVNNVVLSSAYYSAIFENANIPASLAAFPTTLIMLDGTFNNTAIGTTLGGEDLAWPEGRNVTQYQVVDDFSYNLSSKHTLKLGLNFHRNDISDHDSGIYTSGEMLDFIGNFFNGQSIYYLQTFPAKENYPIAIYGLGWYVQDEWRVTPSLKLTVDLRMDHPSNPICQDNCFARFASDFASLNHDITIPYNQAIVSGQHQAIANFNKMLWQPRLGFAWTPFGLKNTVLRGGFGMFGDTFPGQIADFLSENSPIQNTFVAAGPISKAQAGNVFATDAAANATFLAGFASGGTATSLGFSLPGVYDSGPSFANAAKIVSPMYEEWNLELQQGIGQATSVNINYVGNHGYHETVQFNGVNGANTVCDNGSFPVPFGPGGCSDKSTPTFTSLPYIPADQRFTAVNQIETVAVSNYNGLVVSVQHRFSHGLQLQGSFSWSHALDEISNGGFNPFNATTAASLRFPVNNNDLRQYNYGNADYDVRKYGSISYVYELPYWKGPKPLAQGWQLSGTLFTRSGLPVTVIDSGTAGLLSTYYGGAVYANYNGAPQPSCGVGAASAVAGGNPGQPIHPCFLTADLTASPTGYGTQRRNQFYGPDYFDTDFTVMKYTNMPHWERGKLGLGVQFFNFFNHPNFDEPVNNVANTAYFGQIIKTVYTPTSILGSFLGGDASPRLIQLTAKFNF